MGKTAFREAFVNALVHRDYSQLGAVDVRIDDNGLTISNPGGFVEGVTLNYIDTHNSIKRAEAAELCRISPYQASRLLKKW